MEDVNSLFIGPVFTVTGVQSVNNVQLYSWNRSNYGKLSTAHFPNKCGNFWCMCFRIEQSTVFHNRTMFNSWASYPISPMVL